MRELVLASGNAGKLKELNAALAPLELKLRPVSEWTGQSPVEDGDSFAANALIKARHAAAISGLPSLADDSGLEVAALNGAPGLYSARYAGPDANDDENNRKLLDALKHTPDNQRHARFTCVIALVRDAEDPAPVFARGEWSGQILQQPRGEQGFGYDPLFLDPQLGLSAAEMPRDLKLSRSHRGLAIARLLELLQPPFQWDR